jgi:hypothetical protein
VSNFLGAITHPIRTHKLWQHAEEDELADTIDAIGARV